MSLFFLRTSTYLFFLLVYVDDIIITGSHSTFVQHLIITLTIHFSLNDLGDFKYFLGVEVHRHPNGLFLSQTKYIHDILSKGSMSDATPLVLLLIPPFFSLSCLVIPLMTPPPIALLLEAYNTLLSHA